MSVSTLKSSSRPRTPEAAKWAPHEYLMYHVMQEERDRMLEKAGGSVDVIDPISPGRRDWFTIFRFYIDCNLGLKFSHINVKKSGI